MSFIQARVVILIKYCVILLIYVAELFITSIPLSENMREHVTTTGIDQGLHLCIHQRHSQSSQSMEH